MNQFPSTHVCELDKVKELSLCKLKTLQTFSVWCIAMGRRWSTHSRATIVKRITTHASIIERITTEVLICTRNSQQQISQLNDSNSSTHTHLKRLMPLPPERGGGERLLNTESQPPLPLLIPLRIDELPPDRPMLKLLKISLSLRKSKQNRE